MKNLFKSSILLLTLGVSLFSCSDDDIVGDDTPEVGDSIITDTSLFLDIRTEEQNYFHFAEDAENANLSVENAQEVFGTDGSVLAFIKDDYVYMNDSSGEVFKKVAVDSEGVLSEVASVPNLGTGGQSTTVFLDDNTILHTSDQFYAVDGVYSYQIIDIDTMQQTAIGTFELPITADEDNEGNYQMWANEYVSFEGNIYIPFVESDMEWNVFYDVAYVAVYDASTLDYVKTITTDSTASLCNGMNPSYAVDESGDLYMSSSNTNRYSGIESVPSGIVRIKSGETDFDADYFLDITALTGFHSLGMLYIGNGEAIVQVFNTDLSESGYDVEYYLVDLAAETANKLDIPASSSNRFSFRRSLALLGNGNAAIMVSHADGNSVYIYDTTTETISEGTTYTGADYLGGLRAF